MPLLSFPVTPYSGAPAAMSGTPSPSMSPRLATEEPKLSLSTSGGPLAVELFISAVLFTVPSEFMNSTCSAPLLLWPSLSSGAPAAMSGTPSPSKSPRPATEEPNSSPSDSEGPFEVDELISAALFTVPSEFMNSTCSAPLSLPPASSSLAPAATSGTPSPSMSPTPAADEPNASQSASRGPPAVDELIWDIWRSVPSSFVNSSVSSPRFSPPVSLWGDPTAISAKPSPLMSPALAAAHPNLSPAGTCSLVDVELAAFSTASAAPLPGGAIASMRTTCTSPAEPARGAPAAMSGVPSPSMSPMPAADEPNASPSDSEGPFGVDELISNVLFAVPSGFISTTCTAPLPSPPASPPGAPAAMSGMPSASRSPSAAAEEPNASPSDSEGPFGVDELISNVLFAVPSGFISTTCTAPLPSPPASPPGAPAAMSGMPSASRSPSAAAEEPNASPSESEGPLAVDELISAVLFTVPSGFMNSTCSAPLSADAPPGPSSPSAPAAMSCIPSPSMSPRPAADEPNASPSDSEGPLAAELLISAVLFTVPSEFMNSTCSAPLPLPPASSPGAPAAMSGTPSRSRSPTPASEEPNASPSESEGPLAVDELILAVLFTVPSVFMNMTWTAPLSLPPASSPGAPAAMSGTPSPSRSPMPAAEWPKLSLRERIGPNGVPSWILAVLFAVPSEFMNMTWIWPLLGLPGAPATMSGTPSRSRSPIPAALFPKSAPADTEGPVAVPACIFDADAGYAQLCAYETAEPDCRRRLCAPGVFTVTARCPAPGPYPSNATELWPADPAMRAPPGPIMYSNDTSAPGPSPRTVPP